MSDSPHVPGSFNKSADRRSWPRRIPDTLTYIHLGSGNGGIILNVSEGGLRLASAGILSDDDNPPMRLRLPGTQEWIDTPGQIVWTSKSRKEAGVKFVGLAESDRDRIKSWMALDAPRVQMDKDAHKVTEQRSEPNNAPKTVEPNAQDPTPVVVENKVSDQKKISQQAQPPVPPVSTPDAPTRPAREPIFSLAVPIEERPEDPELKSWRDRTARRTIIDGRVGLWLTAISLMSLIAIISFVLGLAAGRGAWNEMLGIFGIDSGVAKRTVGQENPGVPASSRDSAAIGLILPLENLPLPPTGSIPEASLEIPVVPPVRQMTIPRSPLIAPAPRALAATMPPGPIPDRVSKKPSPATEVERVPPPQVKSNETPRPEIVANSSPTVPSPETVPSPIGSIEIIPDLYPTIPTPSESKAGNPRSGTSLRIGRLISRIAPVYPSEALRQRIAGTVKLHVLIGRDGSVARVELLEGPAYLTEAARAAVEQWKYEPTMLGGEPVEAEENITIVFRIANSVPAAN